MRPRLLDLFCGAGGAGVGYARAGFDVIGVDIKPQPNYPYKFVQMDWREGVDRFERVVAAIHASPPCQAYSTIGKQWDRPRQDLYTVVRDRLRGTGLPWVIENVIGAPYQHGVMLCGSMFDLKVRRHRNFEMSHMVLAPQCNHKEQGTPLGVYGHGGGGKMTRGVKARQGEWGGLMGMEWAKPQEISQAIPPAYTEWIGGWLLGNVLSGSFPC